MGIITTDVRLDQVCCRKGFIAMKPEGNSSHRRKVLECLNTVPIGRLVKVPLLILIFFTGIYAANVLFKNEDNRVLPPISGSGSAPAQMLIPGDGLTISKVKAPSVSPPHTAHSNLHPTVVDPSMVPKHLAQQQLLDCLTTGEWQRESYTEEQETEMKVFLSHARKKHKLPVPLQRKDGVCGNTTFPGLTWFRAVCDPQGDTPCCMEGRCQDKSTQECVCDSCFDLRQRLYAELSTWKSRDAQCQVRQYSSNETCRVLDGGNFHFIGDSHMRHMYMGLQILLTGDEEFGCMGQNLSRELKSKCHGLYMFTEKACRKKFLSSMSLCGGRIQLHMSGLYSTKHAKRILKVVSSLIGKQGTVLVIGLGHHDSFQPNHVIPKVASPVVDIVEKSGQSWPKIIWIGAHSMGLLKTPVVPNHLNPSVLKLNKALGAFLKSKRVNFLNTFNLTLNVASQDGSHYGKGANLLKARVLVEYVNRIGGINSISDPPDVKK